MTGGNYSDNNAEAAGGFVYKEGDGYVNCSGAIAVNNRASDGGAIFMWKDAVLKSQCDLVGNEAVSGAAM